MKWIKYSEQLSKLDKGVLIYGYGNGIEIAWLIDHYFMNLRWLAR